MEIIGSKTWAEDNECQGNIGIKIKIKSWSHLDSLERVDLRSKHSLMVLLPFLLFPNGKVL